MERKVNWKDIIFILVISVFSRMFYIGLAKISNDILEPFDHSAKILQDKNKNFEYLLRWDAIPFLHIIKKGYVTEHTTAFFPLFPLLTRKASDIFKNDDYLKVGVIINNILFILSTLILYKISTKRYRKEIGEISTLLFIFNPASIIYSTIYSESLSTFLFMIFFYFIESRKFHILSSIILSLSGITRSNNILLALFFIENLKFSCKNIFTIFFKSLPILISVSSFQIYIYNILNLKGFKIPYSHIQSKYWNQGFLKFYKYKHNIPNFFVGLPFILNDLYMLVSLFKTKFYSKGKFNTLWLSRRNIKYIQNKNTVVLAVLVFIQAFMCLFFIHTQIYVRFVAYNPLIYWSMAFRLRESGLFFKLVIYGYLFYGVAYAILFGAYYPPA